MVLVAQQAALTALIYGESGAGKSDLADTVPGIRLVLDVEGGSEYTPSWPKQIWNPNFPPPGFQGCQPGMEQPAETVRVICQDWATWERVRTWLMSGQHPFTSMVVDSLTEWQKRCRDQIRGTEQMQTQHWGDLLVQMETSLRELRDVTKSPHNRLQNLIVLALIDPKDKGRPFVQGSLQIGLPGFVDLVGYMATPQLPDGTGIYRTLQVQPVNPMYVAKDRTKVITQYLSNAGYVHIRDQIRPELGGYNLMEFVQALELRYTTNTGGITT